MDGDTTAQEVLMDSLQVTQLAEPGFDCEPPPPEPTGSGACAVTGM